MKYKNLMAKALYDNVPEAPEELAFRKGDILVVIEQNTGGLEGWWLCSLHGRQGIAPGNRLKLLVGPTIEGGTASSQSLAQQQSPHPHQGIYQVPPLHQSTQGKDQPIYQVPPTQDVYQVPQRSTLADGMTSRVVTPTRSGQAYTFGLAHSPAPSPANSLYDVPSLQGVYDIPPIKQVGKSSHGQSSDIPPSQVVHIQGVYDVLPPSREYSLQPCEGGAALEESSYDVPQTHRQKPEGVYDVPPAFLSKSPQCSQSTQSNYDFPPSSEPCVATSNDSSNSIYDVPSSQPPATGSHDLYDIPRGFQRVREQGRCIYDAPAADVRPLADVTDGMSRLSFSSTGSSMSTSSSSAGSPAEGCLKASSSALARLGRLTQALDSSVSALQRLVCSLPESRAGERRAALERICGALADLLALGRSSALSDTTLLRRLEEAQMVLQQAQGGLDGGTPAIRLHRALTVSRAMLDDARQLVSTIGGSAELLFRRAPVEGIVHPFTCSPPDQDNHSKDKAFPVEQDSERCVTSWMEDYDYVHLQGKEEFERQQKELLEKENIVKQSRMHLGQDQDCDQDQLIQFKKLEQEVTKPVENDITQWISHQHSTGSSSPSDSSSVSSGGGGVHLCGRDRQLLLFYAEQYEQHFVTLLNTIDAFFGCVAGGQPPRIFVAHAKFVILSAHKLVFIGDTLSRQASSPDVANRVMDSSNTLCNLLKTVVGSTKTAALHYPHTAAVQDMVDRVTLLSHQAQQLKLQLVHMASF